MNFSFNPLGPPFNLSDSKPQLITEVTQQLPNTGTKVSSVYTVPAGNTLLCNMALLDLVSAPTGTQTVSVSLGTSTSSTSAVLAQSVSSSTPVGELGGRVLSTLGADFDSLAGYVARYPAGTILQVTAISPGVTKNIFGSAVPAGVQSSLTGAWTTAIAFRSDVAGTITKARFYKSTDNTGTHVGHIWRTDGTLLGSVTYTNETSTGWQEASFVTPIVMAANTIYVSGTYCPNGHIWLLNTGPLNTEIDNLPLRAVATAEYGNARYNQAGADPTFPGTDGGGAWYGADVEISYSSSQANDGSVVVDLYGVLLPR